MAKVRLILSNAKKKENPPDSANTMKRGVKTAIRSPRIDLRSSIPLELQNCHQWVVYATRPGDNGRTNKIPIDRKTGRPLKSWQESEQLLSFEKAYKEFRLNPHEVISGLGFVLSKDDDMTIIDLDGAIDKGQIKPWAREIIEKLDTYTEVSPSGNGFHIILKGKHPDLTKKKMSVGAPGENVEIFCRSGFVTITGVIHEGRSEIKKSQALKWLIKKYSNKEPNRNGQVGQTSRLLADEEVVARLSHGRSALKFKALMAGDISGYDDDHSRADLALCAIIAQQSVDSGQIDRIFRSSGLMREKWDESGHFSASPNLTYGQHTIEIALRAKISEKIRVLGRTTEVDILLWIEGNVVSIKPKAMDNLVLNILTGEENPAVIQHIKKNILREAYLKGFISINDKIGPGVWKIKDSFLLNTGTKAYQYDGICLHRIDEPVFEGRIIEFSGSEWLDIDQLEASIDNGSLKDVYAEVYEKVRPFSWASPEIGEYAACFAMLSVMQHAMNWRPLIYLLGPRGSGKTMFLDYILGALYGNLFASLGKSTAFAMAQEIGNTGKIAALDEFEKSKHLGSLLETAKLASRGGYVSRGTPGPRALKYVLNHMLWCASIYLPQQAQTDSAIASRMVILEMKKPDSPASPPSGVSVKDGPELAGRIVGTMIRYWKEITVGVEKMISNMPTIIAEMGISVETRTLENYARASAILNIVTDKKRYIPDWARKETEDDGDKILQAIFDSIVTSTVSGQKYTIGEVLSEGETKTIEVYGIKILKSGDLAINTGLVERSLLKDSQFRDLNISDPLSRLPGATKKKQRMNKRISPCIVIPAEVWNPHRKERFKQPGNDIGNNKNISQRYSKANVTKVPDNFEPKNILRDDSE